MRCSWLAALAVGACSTENDLNRSALEPGEAVRWDDDTKASTVSRHFVATFPALYSDDSRVLLFRSAHDTEVTVTQRAPLFGWAAEYLTRFTLSAGLTRTPLDFLDWLVAEDASTYLPPERSFVSSAFVIESDASIEVLALWDLPLDHDPAITRLLPIQELGTRYQIAVPGATDEPEWEFTYHVVAVENDTEVHAAPMVEPIMLEAGEMVRIALLPDEVTADLSWLVSSDRPVAVFSGGGACNWAGKMSWEQLPPVSRWGTEYIAIPIDGHESSDLVLVSDESALVELDCGGPRTVLAGQVVRVEIRQPTRVVASRPILALVESRVDDCGPSNDSPSLVALTPEALGRGTVALEPLEFVHSEDFLHYGAEITTLAAVTADGSLVPSNPPLSPVQVASVGDSLVELLRVDTASTIEGGPFRGIEYGVAPYDYDSDVEFYTEVPFWIDVTYATHLGYDCTSCVQRLTDPVVCP